jgi:predicted nuclease with TOPRIM domain
MGGIAKTGVILGVVAALGYVVMSVRSYISQKAQYEALQEELATLRADNEILQEDVAELRVTLREDSLVIDSLRTERTQLREENKELVAEGRNLASKLTEARAARYQSDSLLAAARHAVDETVLPRPVFQLLMAERAASDNAHAEAEACDAALGNCEEQKKNLESQVGTLEVESQTLQKDLDEAVINVNNLQAFNARQDTVITDLNEQLKPSFWKSLTSKDFIYGAGLGGLVTSIIAVIAR